MKKLILIGLLVFISVSGFVTYNIYKEKEHTRDLISFTENLQSQEINRISEQSVVKKDTMLASTSVSVSENSIKDCKNNFDCFIESSKTCSQAKVNQIVSMDFSYEVKNDVDFEIKGIKNNKCEISFTIKTSTLSFIDDPNASQQIRDQVKEMMKSAQDEVSRTVATKPLNNCLFKDKTLTTMLEGIKNSAFHLSINGIASDQYKVFENLSNNNCNGPFILN